MTDQLKHQLLEASAELTAALGRRRPADVVKVAAAVESAVVVQARFVDSHLARVSCSMRTGGCVRAYTVTGFRQVASTAPSVDLATDLLGGAPSAAPALDLGQLPLEVVDLAEVANLLRGIDEGARAVDPRISQVVVDLETTDQLLCVGGCVDRRKTTYLTIRAVWSGPHGKLVTGTHTPGITASHRVTDARVLGAEAARRALAKTDAVEAPVGHFPVVVAGGRGIVLLHEACCHALEADEVLRGSAYSGRLGSQIAAPGVTIADNPTQADLVGAYGVDDEGLPARSTTLVDDGRLVNVLTTAQTARELGVDRTPNARAETVLQSPIPRMSNTCLSPGTATPEQIIGDINLGVYAEHVGGGEVVEATGSFVFRMNNGRMIRRGRLAEPLRETTLAGSGPEVLRSIHAVADDVAVGAARCGKNGQAVLVGLSGPTIAVRSLLVGGTRG